jgi:hypothetical protein
MKGSLSKSLKQKPRRCGDARHTRQGWSIGKAQVLQEEKWQ